MLGAVRFIPRDDAHGRDEERTRDKDSKKRKHGSKDDRSDRKEKSKSHSHSHSRRKDEKRKHGLKEDPKKKSKHKPRDEDEQEEEYSSDGSGASSEDSEDLPSRKNGNREMQENKRKEAGLEWMNLAPERPPAPKEDDALRLEPEKPISNVKELNPYWKNDGKGLPSEEEKRGLQAGARPGRLPPPPGVGDGGASWRMKALKRAQEQAAREGRQLDEVVEERWGSLATLTNSVTVQRAAHANAHMHAKRDRTRKATDDRVVEAPQGAAEGRKDEGEGNEAADADDKRIRSGNRDYLKDIKAKDNRMRQPQVDRKLSWRNKGSSMRPEDAAVLRAAAQTYNKFSNDGTFLNSVRPQEEESNTSTHASSVTRTTTTTTSTTTRVESSSRTVGEAAVVSQSVTRVESHSVAKDAVASTIRSAHQVENAAASSSKPVAGVGAHNIAGGRKDVEPPPTRVVDTERKGDGCGAGQVQNLSSNQIAAKVMQLRLRGKHKEADELQKQGEAAASAARQQPAEAKETDEEEEKLSRPGPSQVLARLEALGKKTLESRRESADKTMAGMIGRNKLYKADDEYDDLGPQAEKKKKGAKEQRPTVQANYNRIQTQAERCQLCFDNVNRPKHLTMAIANFTYLSLPPRRPLVDGHCFIVPMQHEGATRNVDDDTWEELRNFKKCLVRMFAEQEKDAIFLETAMHLARQKRHCVVECIPIPTSFGKDAPLYFKKAIDEAESEWSQHNAKKLIDTRTKGLRASVPKNFPYFHVEFGMNGGYAHVIDDESKFKPDFGRAVLEGMLEIEEEDFHNQSVSRRDQEKLTKDFAKLWEPHDWTKMLE